MAVKTFESLPLPNLVRYGLTGVVGVALFFLVPTAILSPGVFAGLATVGGVSGLFLAGIATGFLLDALKIYQFSSNYKKIRDAFMGDLAGTLGIEKDTVSYYFSKCAQLERTKSDGTISLQHSRWVMMTVCSLLFVLAGAVWSLSGAVYMARSMNDVGIRFLAAAAFAFLIGWRLIVTSLQERIKVNRAYLNFCSENRDSILRPILAKTEETEDGARTGGKEKTD